MDDKERRGFAAMTKEKRREIASKGGRAAHLKGTAHEWTSEEARDAGRLGGIASRGGKGKLPQSSEEAPPCNNCGVIMKPHEEKVWVCPNCGWAPDDVTTGTWTS
jgi:uncharacterized protein